ncbi:Pentatricopeptide repeat-containing protein [Durusdinium trenchii]|uniref:Chloroplastic n=2 Tax=Durusdinium trenchii TaxID=1381693 RepID=A0ABP0LLJ7_9DINO
MESHSGCSVQWQYRLAKPFVRLETNLEQKLLVIKNMRAKVPSGDAEAAVEEILKVYGSGKKITVLDQEDEAMEAMLQPEEDEDPQVAKAKLDGSGKANSFVVQLTSGQEQVHKRRPGFVALIHSATVSNCVVPAWCSALTARAKPIEMARLRCTDRHCKHRPEEAQKSLDVNGGPEQEINTEDLEEENLEMQDTDGPADIEDDEDQFDLAESKKERDFLVDLFPFTRPVDFYKKLMEDVARLQGEYLLKKAMAELQVPAIEWLSISADPSDKFSGINEWPSNLRSESIACLQKELDKYSLAISDFPGFPSDARFAEEVICPVTAVLFNDEQKVLQALRCPGNAYFCDGVIKFDKVLMDGKPGTVYAMQVGSSRFVNSYPGARRGPNAIFRVTTSRGPNCGSIELVAQTTNYVGIAPKAETVVSYGMHYDLARQMSEDVLQQDKRFRGSLEQLFQKNAASAGLGQDATNPSKPIDENAVDPGQPGPLVPAADPVVGDGAGDAGATVLATLADPPCDFLLPGETLSVRSNDKESNRKVLKRTILKQWQTGKFVRGKQDDGILYEITPTYLVYYQDEKKVLSLKALIAKTQATCVHGFKPFPEGSVTSKLVASAEEPLYLTKFDEEIHQVQKAMASVPYMKMLWCFSFDAATKKLNPAGLALVLDKQLFLKADAEIESADGGRPPTDERRESGAGLTGFTEKSGARSAARVPRYPQHGCLTRSENGFVFDGDNPVVWMERSLEHWLVEVSATDVVLYERWMNNEIMAGNYAVRNSQFGIDFLDGWAAFEEELPKSGYHSSDNGAIHLHLLRALGLRNEKPCTQHWSHLGSDKNFMDEYYAFVSCTRLVMGAPRRWKIAGTPRITILPRGHAWAIDGGDADSKVSSVGAISHHGQKTEVNYRQYFQDDFMKSGGTNCEAMIRDGFFVDADAYGQSLWEKLKARTEGALLDWTRQHAPPWDFLYLTCMKSLSCRPLDDEEELPVLFPRPLQSRLPYVRVPKGVSFEPCAGEWETCHCVGFVYFGTDTRRSPVVRAPRRTGRLEADNFEGDPAVGDIKKCHCAKE